jgi:Holliday junction DNA helicase RuvA
MIAYVSGKVGRSGADWVIVDVHGVGLRVGCSARTLSALGPFGEPVTLHTEMLVREDAITLVGFLDLAEHGWFGQLQGVQGVGAKVALAILSALSPEDLVRAIGSGDAAFVARAQGVGPKLAARIVNELKDKVPAFGGAVAGTAAPAPRRGTPAADALSALANLGFRPQEAARAVADAQGELGEDAAVDELLRVALRRSAR